MPIHFYIYCIAVSLLSGLVNYRWLKPCRMQKLVPFLALTLAVELVGAYMDHRGIDNGLLYNVYVFLQVLFCAWFLRDLTILRTCRRLILYGSVLYIILSLAEYIFNIPPTNFSINLFLLGGLLVTIFAILFLFDYFLLDVRSLETRAEPAVWVAAGMIVYFAVLSICVSRIKEIVYYQIQVNGVILHNVVARSLSVLLYLCFAYAFYRCRKLNLK